MYSLHILFLFRDLITQRKKKSFQFASVEYSFLLLCLEGSSASYHLPLHQSPSLGVLLDSSEQFMRWHLSSQLGSSPGKSRKFCNFFPHRPTVEFLSVPWWCNFVKIFVFVRTGPLNCHNSKRGKSTTSRARSLIFEFLTLTFTRWMTLGRLPNLWVSVCSYAKDTNSALTYLLIRIIVRNKWDMWK